jgi:hypothetical protein
MRQNREKVVENQSQNSYMVGPTGLEPATRGVATRILFKIPRPMIPTTVRNFNTTRRRRKRHCSEALVFAVTLDGGVLASIGRAGQIRRGGGNHRDQSAAPIFFLFVVDFEMLVFVLVSIRVRKKKSREFNWLSVNVRYLRGNGRDEGRMLDFAA